MSLQKLPGPCTGGGPDHGDITELCFRKHGCFRRTLPPPYSHVLVTQASAWGHLVVPFRRWGAKQRLWEERCTGEGTSSSPGAGPLPSPKPLLLGRGSAEPSPFSPGWNSVFWHAWGSASIPGSAGFVGSLSVAPLAARAARGGPVGQNSNAVASAEGHWRGQDPLGRLSAREQLCAPGAWG